MFQLRRYVLGVVPSSHLLESEVSIAAKSSDKERIISEVSAYLNQVGLAGKRSAQRPIAIEVDGPSHFYVNSNKYTAYTKLKHRILTRMGYNVVHIPYFEWNKLGTSHDKEQYVIEKLKAQNTHGPSDGRLE
jgi:RAP domain